MDQFLVDAVGANGATLAKGVGTALLVASLAWVAVRGALARVPQTWIKWAGSLVFSIGMVLLAHGADVVTYGDGGAGWARAVFFGLLAGCLAPTVGHRVVKRFLPGLQAPKQGGK